MYIQGLVHMTQSDNSYSNTKVHGSQCYVTNFVPIADNAPSLQLFPLHVLLGYWLPLASRVHQQLE